MRTSLLLTIALLGEVNAQTNQWYSFPTDSTEAATRRIFADEAGNVWVGGYNNGLHRYQQGHWTHYTTANSGLANNDVRQMCYDASGDLWITTWDGLSVMDTTLGTCTNQTVSIPTSDILYSCVVGDDGHVWVGTDGGADPEDGLYEYDGNQWTLNDPTNSALTGRWILDLQKDANGTIWGAHYRGLIEINDGVITNHLLTDAGFSTSAGTACMAFDSYGNVWVGVVPGNEGGLARFDGTAWTTWTPTNSPMPDDEVWSIAVDRDNVVWAGTNNSGLVRFDGANWTTFNTDNTSLGSNHIDALAIDPLNNLWIAPNYDGVHIYNPDGVSGLAGVVYVDADLNGIYDAGEPLLEGQMVSATPDEHYALSDANGHYQCPLLNADTYTATLQTAGLHHVLAIVPPNVEVEVSNTANGTQGIDFGVQLIPNIQDVAILHTPVNIPRPGFGYTSQLTISNHGTQPTGPLHVVLHDDDVLLLDSVSVPFTLADGDSLVWDLPSLPLFGSTTILIHYHVPALVDLIGEFLTGVATVSSDLEDATPQDNSDPFGVEIRGSFDPNDKAVIPQGEGISGLIPENTGSLDYTVRFQNTGTDTAFTVVLRDTIDMDIDLGGFEMLASGHPYTVEVHNPRVLVWRFENILLPDSGTNEVASHGFIRYRLPLREDIVPGTVITNKADIYFDFNPPVTTNLTVNTIENTTGFSPSGVPSSSWMTVFPNPAEDMVHLILARDGVKDIRILDMQGRQVRSLTGMPGRTVTVHGLPPGSYVVQVTSSGASAQQRLIVTGR